MWHNQQARYILLFVELLYKYFDPCGIRILQTSKIHASDPSKFNDPFEVRPAVDQERQDHFVRGYERLHGSSLTGHGTMVGVRPKDAPDLGEELNERFRNDLRSRYRVLCLSRNSKSVLMWGHYTRSHRGFVVGFDPATAGFATGIREQGFEIDYPPQQERVMLPLPYYSEPSIENWDTRGNLVNDPRQMVECSGGITITFDQYREMLEEAYLKLLTTKAYEWKYEEEVRFIYDLRLHAESLLCENHELFVKIPPNCIKEVITGFRASYNLANMVVKSFRDGVLRKAKLFYATPHPYRYEVQANETTPESILDYYGIIKRAQAQ